MPRYPSRPSSLSSSSFGFSKPSTAIQALIAANVLVFFATWIAPSLQLQLGLVPMWVVREKRVWQLLTYMFVHAGLFHILFNMLTLWMFGAELERIWGTRFFLKFYFITGVGAACLTVLLSLLPIGPLQQLYASDIVGASGAVYGLLLAYALYFPDRTIYYIVFPMPARMFVLLIGAIAFFTSLTESGGVANATHLGGLLVAYVYLTSLRKGPRLQLNPWAEVKYRWFKWRLASAKKKFDVYTGGRGDDWNRRVH